jgi:hypothetical protein
MDWSNLVPLIVMGTAAGMGVRSLGYVLPRALLKPETFPAAKFPEAPASWFERVWENNPQESPFPKSESGLVRFFSGSAVRHSSILGMVGPYIRHTDGAYSRCYRVQLPESFYDSDLDLARKLDVLSRVVTADLPKDTILAFRYSVSPDRGRVIDLHQERKSPVQRCYGPARAYHDATVEFYSNLAANDFFRQANLLLWVKVPPDGGTSSKVSTFFSDLIHVSQRESGAGASSDGALLTDEVTLEKQALNRAQDIFGQVENLFVGPLTVDPLSGSETFAALYLSQNPGATSIPAIDHASGSDLRPYLCGETIEVKDWYVLHGNTPVAVVSLFVPPQPFVPDDFSKIWTQNSATFRHVVITEFVSNDVGQSKHALDKRIRQLRISGRRLNGSFDLTAEARNSLDQLGMVRDAMTKPGSALTRMRISVLVYGNPIADQSDRTASKAVIQQLRDRCEDVIRWLRTVTGTEAAIEERVALAALYERFLLGESLPTETGREIMEVGSSLTPFVPSDGTWPGSRRPVSILSTRNGRLIGINLFDRELCPTPLAMVLGAPRSGKSVLMGRFILDTLSELPEACAIAADFGESFGPMVDVLGGRHLRFTPDSGETINIWDYVGLAQGLSPDDVQVELVLGEMLRLARIHPDSEHAIEDEKILKHAIRIVYQNIVPMNRPGSQKVEPVLSNLVAVLDNYQDDTPELVVRASRLRTILEDYIHRPMLNQPTSERFLARSRFDVFELDSLNQFSRDEAVALAYRVAARMIQSIGKKQADGTHAPTLLVFDEVHKIIAEFPEMILPMKKGARQGGKHNVVTVIGTHNYEDVAPIHDLLKNAGTRIIAQLASEFRMMAEDLDFTPAMVDAVKTLAIKPGHFAQYAYLVGNGPGRKFEVLQLNLSPLELWQTANPDLINARARVRQLRPHWRFIEVLLFLANRYPTGITAEEVERITEETLTVRSSLQ